MDETEKLNVDQDICIGCTLCTCIAPNTFSMNVMGKSEVVDQNADTPDRIKDSIDQCPVKCISYI